VPNCVLPGGIPVPEAGGSPFNAGFGGVVLKPIGGGGWPLGE
jgi:hypothetical protein